MEKLLRERLTRSMADALRELEIDLDDRSMCFMQLWERGYRAEALDACMDAARCMARIRISNEERKQCKHTV